MQTTTMIRRAVDRARRLPQSPARLVRWPLALGALLLAASTASVLATTNTPPKFESATFSRPVIDEGDTGILVVRFTDPDPDDFHTIRLRWPEDGVLQVIQLPPHQTSVQVPHVFKDVLAESRVQVAVLDRQLPPHSPNDNTEGAGRDVAFASITVKNVAPRFEEGSVKVTKLDTRKVVVEGGLIDPGSADTISVEAAWGDPADKVPTACSMSNGDRRFRCEHTYPSFWGVPRTYHIGLRALDDDGGLANHQTSVRLP